ncbi:MAG TPA: dethiobiotin synthase [Stellaceae bacterium]|nr:dethiobiotin synthase [Stellaceae bacterium]
MSAFFVTATGTEIGKTFVTAGLIRHCRAHGQAVNALKPVLSGFDAAAAARSDAGILLDALGQEMTRDTLDGLSPWRFAAPMSPDMAARRENRMIDFNALLGVCRAAIAARDGRLFIEGVGGVMVPLDTRHTVLDWIAALALPAILVAGSYLGTISHTLTALDALTRRGVDVRALVLNESVDATVPMDETLAALRRFAPRLSIATLSRVTAEEAAKRDFARLAAFL